MNIPILKVIVSKDQFSAINKIFPAHEFPIWLSNWGQENLEIVGKAEDVHKIESMEEEVERMVSTHGVHKLQEVFGASYIDGIEVSINRIIEKEKNIDGSTNTAKSKNRVSAEARV